MGHDLRLSDMISREFGFSRKTHDATEIKKESDDRASRVDEKGFLLKRGSSSVGRASAFQAEGRGFDPRFPLHCDKRYW